MAEKQTHYLRQLRDRVAKSFDEEELRALVFDLGLDWDELQGTRKTVRVQDLIVQLGRNGRLSELVYLLREKRPHLAWPTPPLEQQKQDIPLARPSRPFWKRPWFIGTATVIAILAGLAGIYADSGLRDWLMAGRATRVPLAVEMATVTSSPSMTDVPTTTPTAALETSTSTLPSTLAVYDFELEEYRWVSSEESYKTAVLGIVTEPVHSGRQALQLLTELYDDPSNEVFRHTEAVTYFADGIPSNMIAQAPYDLTGKQVACWVYPPAEMAPSDEPQATVRIFVRDDQFRNQWGESLGITSGHADKWFLISMIIGTDNADAEFDSTKINAIGVRFDIPDGSPLSFSGSIYIDDCTIDNN